MSDLKVSTRSLPWVRMGVDVSSACCAEEAIELAGLDWDVELQDLYAGPKRRQVEGVKATVRTDTGAVLGVVRGRYSTYQNREAFSFMNSLIASGDVVPTHAGEDRGGAVAFVGFRLPSTFEVAGDQYESHLFLRTTHDGSGAVTVNAMPVRVLCTNGMCLTLPGAAHRWSVSHVGDVAARMHEASKTMKLEREYGIRFADRLEEVNHVKLSDDQLAGVVARTWRQAGPRAFSRFMTELTQVRRESPTIADEQRPTALGALCAVSEYCQHVRESRTEHALLRSTLEGVEAKLRDAVAAESEE